MGSGTIIASMALETQLESASAALPAAQKGDARAQALIFDAYKQKVAAQVFRMTGDANVVDDLVQEVFISAFGGLPRFRGDSNLGTWLYRITTNKVRNWWDSKRRREARERHAPALDEMVAAPQEARIERREHHSRLYRALGELPDNLREAFVARAIQAMSLQEASECLGVPISTVSYRARRAEQLLCVALGIETEGTS